MGVRIVDLVQNSPEWMRWRTGVIGASRAAAIIGESKFCTAYELWLEMTNRKKAFEGNEFTERGTEMEGAARAAYEMHMGFIEAKPVCVLHPVLDYIGASLDGLDDNMIPVEIKYPSVASHAEALAGIVPRHYYIQVQHQLMCVPDAPYANYWSYRDNQPALVRVNHDKDLQQRLLIAEIAFWELVKTDTPPPLTERDAKLIDSPDALVICSKILERKDKASKIEIETLKKELIQVGGHNRVRCGGILVSKTVTASGKDSYRLTVSSVAT